MCILGIVDCVRGGSLSLKQTFSFHLLLTYYYSLLNLLIHLFVVLFGTVSCFCYLSCHKTPIAGARPPKRPRVEIVPVLGLTPSIATLLGKRPEGSVCNLQNAYNPKSSIAACLYWLCSTKYQITVALACVRSDQFTASFSL